MSWIFGKIIANLRLGRRRYFCKLFGRAFLECTALFPQDNLNNRMHIGVWCV